ncbi:MAG: hypothetical protein CVU36_03240 [Betaproteobacteria bacterium HGW-Betaproteobacteria-9]|nr:MAG: hypothetical protein CVU36_03240 [Betaproteobacteria bacterium HGW-Betaproteobacteria-9]
MIPPAPPAASPPGGGNASGPAEPVPPRSGPSPAAGSLRVACCARGNASGLAMSGRSRSWVGLSG